MRVGVLLFFILVNLGDALAAVTATGKPPQVIPSLEERTIASEGSEPEPRRSGKIVSISRVVGELHERHVTSREAQLNFWVSQILDMIQSNSKPKLKWLSTTDTNELAPVVEEVLFEWAVFLEARSFGAEPSHSDAVVAQYLKSVFDISGKSNAASEWKSSEPSEEEIRQMLYRKLFAKDYQRLKTDSLTLVVTDADAESYFTKNRIKFGSLPFENFRESIKAGLAKQGTEQRYKDWRLVLRRKYRIKNYLK